ncbi:MAG: GNAT family protein [Mobilitalea sp.]
MKTIETERLILRPFEQRDLTEFYENSRTPNVGPGAGWEPHKSIEDSQVILDKFLESEEVWALVRAEDNRLIGSVGLHKDPIRSADDIRMLGYVLAEDCWGKGYMTEAAKAALGYAFTELMVPFVTIHHYSFNLRSKRVIDKCGFTYEGTLRHASKIYDGSIYDLACYSMSKEEWQIINS